MSVKFRITGDKEIDAKLAAMPAKVVRKVARRAIRTALKAVQQAAKANAPRKTGTLKKNIKVRAMTRLRDNKNRVGVQVTGGQDFQGPAFHGGFQEFGWNPGKRLVRVKQKKGYRPAGEKKVPGKHFMKAAYDQHKQGVIEDFRENVIEAVEEACR